MAKSVSRLTLDEYRDKYKDFLIFDREDGILTARMHTDGKSAEAGPEWHHALPQAWNDIGGDPENEVVILTGTGDHWLVEPAAPPDPEFADPMWSWPPERFYSHVYLDALHLVENLLWNVDVPTIAAVNGPGVHTEFAFLCDLTLAADDAEFFDRHTHYGWVAGDGQQLVFQQLLGLKRAAYLVYTNEPFTAQQALEWGAVNEVLPREQLLDRGMELARKIMKVPHVARRLQSQVLRRPWKRMFTDDMQAGIAHELLAAMLDHPE